MFNIIGREYNSIPFIYPKLAKTYTKVLASSSAPSALPISATYKYGAIPANTIIAILLIPGIYISQNVLLPKLSSTYSP